MLLVRNLGSDLPRRAVRLRCKATGNGQQATVTLLPAACCLLPVACCLLFARPFLSARRYLRSRLRGRQLDLRGGTLPGAEIGANLRDRRRARVGILPHQRLVQHRAPEFAQVPQEQRFKKAS